MHFNPSIHMQIKAFHINILRDKFIKKEIRKQNYLLRNTGKKL